VNEAYGNVSCLFSELYGINKQNVREKWRNLIAKTRVTYGSIDTDDITHGKPVSFPGRTRNWFLLPNMQTSSAGRS